MRSASAAVAFEAQLASPHRTLSQQTTSAAPEDGPLNFHSWWALISFLICICFVLRPVRLHINTQAIQRRLQRISQLCCKTQNHAAHDHSIDVEKPSGASSAGQIAAASASIPVHSIALPIPVDAPIPSQHPPASAQQHQSDAQAHGQNSGNATAIAANSLHSIGTPQQSSASASPAVRRFFLLDFASVPLATVLLLLCTRTVQWSDVTLGIGGTEDSHVQPYSILILFFSLSYICISLDQTGLLAWLALLVTQQAKTGRQLLFYIYVLAGTMTLVSSNDVVILTLTPLTLAFTRHLHVDPIPYLIMQYSSANVCSSMLWLGNATNISEFRSDSGDPRVE